VTNLQPFLEQQLPDDQTVVLADGLEDAFIGIGRTFNSIPVAIYNTDKVIGILMTRDVMTHEEALEFFDFNIAGAYVGEATPIFMSVMERPTGQFKDTQTSSSSAVITQTQPKPKKKRRKTCKQKL
jgi:hypothetical protein